MSAPLLVIAGPTASGKTAVAVEVCRSIGGEIISADSMQVYKHLSIGTAKPSLEDLQGVPCHLIDHVEPDDQYNLGRFVKEAEAAMADIRSRGKVPVICGGTGLYIRGLLYGVFDGGEPALNVRRELENAADATGLADLYEELLQKDPVSANRYGPNDRQRIIRALEIIRTTGKAFSEYHRQDLSQPRFPVSMFILNWPRAELYERINHRVHVMLERGLLDEVRQYMAMGFSRTNPAIKALGYTELIEHLEGRMELDAALEVMKRKSRNYAKRQETWFRSTPVTANILAAGKSVESVANEIIAAGENIRQT